MSDEEEADNSDCSSQDSGLEVVLDDEGRISGSKSLNLNYKFQSYNDSSFVDISTLEQLKNDVNVVFDGCTTFWLPGRGFEPRTTMERLAKEVFDFHTRNFSESEIEIDWDRSGAEYWTQRRISDELVTKSEEYKATSSFVKNDSSAIRFHWDKDEELIDQSDGNIVVNPQISTVTYLTDGGVPTLIFPYCLPRNINEEDSDDEENDNDNCPEEKVEMSKATNIKQIYASYPKLAKHISFDGRFLHGCPSELQIKNPPNGVRMTFLVNIWINWRPLGPEIFPEEHIASVSNILGKIFQFNMSAENHSFSLMGINEKNQMDRDLNRFTAYFGPSAWDNSLVFDWPSKTYIKKYIDDSNFSSMCIEYSQESDEIGASVSATQRDIMEDISSLDCSGISWLDIRQNFGQYNILLVKNGLSMFSLSKNKTDPSSILSKLRTSYESFPNVLEKNWNALIGNQSKCNPSSILFNSSSNGNKSEANLTKSKRQKTTVKFDKWYARISINKNTDSDVFHDILNKFEVKLNHDFTSADTFDLYLGQNVCTLNDKIKKSLTIDDLSSISCAGHMQLHGVTRWVIIPDEDQDWPMGPPPLLPSTLEKFIIEMEANDLLLINTKLWKCTLEIPDNDFCLGMAFHFT